MLGELTFVVIVLTFPFFIQKGLLRSTGKHQNDQLFPEALTKLRDCTCTVSVELTMDGREQALLWGAYLVEKDWYIGDHSQ